MTKAQTFGEIFSLFLRILLAKISTKCSFYSSGVAVRADMCVKIYFPLRLLYSLARYEFDASSSYSTTQTKNSREVKEQFSRLKIRHLYKHTQTHIAYHHIHKEQLSSPLSHMDERKAWKIQLSTAVDPMK